jgi:hypothetical protein
MNTKSPECYTTDPNARCLRIEASPRKIFILPLDQLTFAELDSDGKEQLLHLSFSTHEVMVHGQPTYEELEPAHRFGFGARSKYGDEYPDWDDDLEDRLKEDWKSIDAQRSWDKDRDAIRYGWDYEED